MLKISFHGCDAGGGGGGAGRRSVDVRTDFVAAREKDRRGEREIAEELARVRRHQEVEVTEEPDLVADEGLRDLVDRLGEPPRDEHHEPHEEEHDVDAKPHNPHRDSGGNHEHEAEEHSRALHPGRRWNGKAGVVVGHVVGTERREAIREEELIGLEPECQP